jgi:hypothetical protein
VVDFRVGLGFEFMPLALQHICGRVHVRLSLSGCWYLIEPDNMHLWRAIYLSRVRRFKMIIVTLRGGGCQCLDYTGKYLKADDLRRFG